MLELMIAIAVAAIFLGTATPSIKQFRANNQIAIAADSILSGLNLSRFTAVTRGRNVLICPSSNSTSCTYGDWNKGWIVFFENAASDSANGFTPAGTDIIRVGTYGGSIAASTGFTQSIVFEADGTTGLGSSQTITLCYADTDVTKRRKQVTVSPFGPISSDLGMAACGS